jgi:hypothetical protein
MSYRSWLTTPHLARSLRSPRAGLARGEGGAPRASSLILGLTLALLVIALVVELFIRLIAAS